MSAPSEGYRATVESQLSGSRFAHLDAMRAAAILLVVISHAGWHFVPGDSGVTVFFVISGFIITHLVLREQERTGGFALAAFYGRRAAKLLPPLAVLVLLPTAVYALVEQVSWRQVAAQVLFVFNWVEVSVGEAHLAVLPGSQVVWSLSVEEQFYIAFALLWAAVVGLRTRRRLLAVVAGVVLVGSVLLRLWLATHGASFERVYRGTDVRADALALGVLAALFWDHPRVATVVRRPGLLLLTLAVLAASFIVRGDVYEGAVRPVFHIAGAAFLICYGFHTRPADGAEARVWHAVVENRLVRLIGVASYSIYLVHLMVITLLGHLGVRPDLRLDSVLLLLVATAAGIAAYLLVEVPVLVARRARRTSPIDVTA